MKTSLRVPLYFLLGFLPVLIAAQEPDTRWHWIVLAASAVYQGALAVKALYSKAPAPDQREEHS